MARRTILVGEEYDGIKVISVDHVRSSNKYRYYWINAKCCGLLVSRPSNAFNVDCKICASLGGKNHSYKHGKCRSKIYNVWAKMIARCTNPNSNRYENYAGRGITVCDSWLESFENFYADMGDRPTPKHSIERINNDKGYSPDNCRWATNKEQANNKTTNVFITYLGTKKTIAQWCDESVSGVTITTFTRRIKNWGIERALSTPKYKRIT